MSSRAHRLYLRNGNNDDPRATQGGREGGWKRARARRMERLWHRWPSTEAAASNGARLWWERESRETTSCRKAGARLQERGGGGRGRERGTEGESLVADREEGGMSSWRSYCSSKGSSALADFVSAIDKDP